MCPIAGTAGTAKSWVKGEGGKVHVRSGAAFDISYCLACRAQWCKLRAKGEALL